MITKIKTGFYDPRSNYSDLDNYNDYDLVGDEVMINNSQRKKLIDLYFQNIQDESDRESRLNELDNLTSVEAEEIIWQFISATW